MHRRPRALVDFCSRGYTSRKYSSDHSSNFDSLRALMSVISVSYAVRSRRYGPDVFPGPGRIVCPSISVALFADTERHLLAAFHKISNVARMNPLPWEDLIISVETRVSLPSSSSLAGPYVCGRERQVTVRIIAPRGVLAKCARYPTRRRVIEQRNDLTLIECLRIWSRVLPQVTELNEITARWRTYGYINGLRNSGYLFRIAVYSSLSLD